MNRLQLATLLSWAGEKGLEGRKRLQKLVFFLQQAGCPLQCQYMLHHYGPYSRDVADACDEMVAAGLIEETVGSSYCYKLTPATWNHLADAPDSKMELFRELAVSLIHEDIWPLELGSTILYFYMHSHDWDMSLAQACKYKKVDAASRVSQAALVLAKRVNGSYVKV